MARTPSAQARRTTKPERAGRAGSHRGDDVPAGPMAVQTRGRSGHQGAHRQGGRGIPRPGASGKARSGQEGAHPDGPTEWAAPDTTLFRDCVDACNRCLAYCLRQGGEHAEYPHIRSLLDCLEACITTADLVGRGSPFAPAFVQLCGEVAKECEESCEQHGHDGEMVRCADACRDLAEWCRLQGTVAEA